MPRLARRPGFSLPEVLVAMVLLGIISASLTKLVVSQMRFFDNVTVSRGARSVARNAMNVVMADLRMVQDSGGVDSIFTSGQAIRIKVPYTFGVFCGTSGGVTTVSMMPTDSAVIAFAVYAGYGVRLRATSRYDMYAPANPVTAAPVTAATPAVCTGSAAGQAGINTITVAGRAGRVLDISTPTIASTTALGSPVMFYQLITYSFAASTMFPGSYALWRTVQNGTTEELMGPFASSARFRYYRTGDDTSRTTVPPKDSLRGVDLVLTAVSSRTPAGRTTPYQSQMVSSVFFKNTRQP